MKKVITVHGVESTDKTIVILSKTGEFYKNGDEKHDKYKIWIKDREGNESRAYQQYQKIRPLAGDKFEIDVFEKESNFVNQQGKTINYTDRTINYFFLDGEGNPTKPVDAPQSPISPVTPQQVQTPTPAPNQALEAKIKAAFAKRDKQIEELLEMVMDLKQKVSYMTELYKIGNPDAFEMHKDQLEPEIPIIKNDETFADNASKALGI